MRASSKDGSAPESGEQLTRSGGATMTFNGVVVDLGLLGLEYDARPASSGPHTYEIEFKVNRRVYARFLRSLLRRRYEQPTSALVRRICFGGRKGRAAERKLRRRAARGTIDFLEPNLTIGTPAYERWALFQASRVKFVTVAGPGGTWTFHGPRSGASRAEKIAWFTATQTEWQLSPEGQGEQQ